MQRKKWLNLEIRKVKVAEYVRVTLRVFSGVE